MTRFCAVILFKVPFSNIFPCLALWKHHVNLLLQNLRGVSTKLNKYIVFTMQTYKKLNIFPTPKKVEF